MYEISLIQRDSLNQPIYDSEGRVKRRYFRSDNGDDIADFWNRNGPQIKRKKGKNEKVHPEEKRPKDKELE